MPLLSEIFSTPHSAAEDCPGCRRRQQLLTQACELADRYRRQYEAATSLLAYYGPQIRKPITVKMELPRGKKAATKAA